MVVKENGRIEESRMRRGHDGRWSVSETSFDSDRDYQPFNGTSKGHWRTRRY